jgi:hypothetical protein
MHQDCSDNPKPTQITAFALSETESPLPEPTQASSNSALAIIYPASTLFFSLTFTTMLPISPDITRVTQ